MKVDRLVSIIMILLTNEDKLMYTRVDKLAKSFKQIYNALGLKVN